MLLMTVGVGGFGKAAMDAIANDDFRLVGVTVDFASRERYILND